MIVVASGQVTREAASVIRELCHSGVGGMDLPVNPPVAPMLAKPVEAIPAGDYVFEPKWDGFRSIVFRDGDEVEIGSRN
jgi:ATP-dependent DNA ligase